MEFVPGLSARDLPPPVTADEMAARFGAPVYTFVEQPTLSESGAGTAGLDGVPIEISLSYSVHRHPGGASDPSDFAGDDGSIAAAISAAEQADQPEWFTERLRQMRLPQLWEAVTTIRLGVEPDRLLAERLAAHVNHVVLNTMPHRRRRHPERMFELDSEVTATHTQTGEFLTIDGERIEAIRIDSDPDVVGWAAEHRGCAVLVVFARDHLPAVRVALVARQLAGEAR
jgi:hypothetical protein